MKYAVKTDTGTDVFRTLAKARKHKRALEQQGREAVIYEKNEP